MRYVLLLLIVFPLSVSAQHKTEITKTFNTYFSHMESGDVLKSLDYMHPGLFDIVPREQLAAVIKESLANPQFEIDMKDGKVVSVSKEVVYENIRYALVNYSFNMIVKLESSADSTMMQMMKQSFTEQFGEDKVVVNESDKTITIHQNSYLYAVNDPSFGGWKFLEKNDQLKEISDRIIPARVSQAI
jgi:hypothetical protein